MRTSTVQPVSPAARSHPRFAEYDRYRAAMSAQLVTASRFDLWLSQTEKRESDRDVVFEVSRKGAALAPGWYKHRFGPGDTFLARIGPFGSRGEAEAAT